MVVRHSCLSLSLTLAMRDAEPFGVESALYLSGLDETIGGKSSTSHEKVRPYFTDNTEGIGRLLVLSRGEILCLIHT
jgi:hypothetical protein